MKVNKQTLDNQALSQANYIGYGFNISGTRSIDSATLPIFDPIKAPTVPFTFLGRTYTVPSYVLATEHAATDISDGVYESRWHLENKLASDVVISASTDFLFGSFNAEIETTFKQRILEDSTNHYAYKYYYSKLAILTFELDDNYYSDHFLKTVEELPDEIEPDGSNLFLFNNFFQQYGSHYIKSLIIGGLLKFYAAASVSDFQGDYDLDTVMHMEYDGLFVSGSIDASLEKSETWKNYKSQSQVSIMALGGDTTKLAAIDAYSPSSHTKDMYDSWLASIKTDPAIVDFKLDGIWVLCGDKMDIVKTAWEKYGNRMHPKISMKVDIFPPRKDLLPQAVYNLPINPPVLSIGTTVLTLPTKPNGPSGVQVVVFDGSQEITESEAVVWNKYYTLPVDQSWRKTLPAMYDSVYNDITSHKLHAEGNVIIFATFGLECDMYPTQELQALLKTAGAGAALDKWLSIPHAGDTGFPAKWLFPNFQAAYSLVGVFGGSNAVEYLRSKGDPDFFSSVVQNICVNHNDGYYTVIAL